MGIGLILGGKIMTLDECIAYLQNVSLERKPRSRKARQIIKYLQEYKAVLEQNQYDKGYKGGKNE